MAASTRRGRRPLPSPFDDAYIQRVSRRAERRRAGFEALTAEALTLALRALGLRVDDVDDCGSPSADLRRFAICTRLNDDDGFLMLECQGHPRSDPERPVRTKEVDRFRRVLRRATGAEGLLVTNTRFTRDAIIAAKIFGIKLGGRGRARGPGGRGAGAPARARAAGGA